MAGELDYANCPHKSVMPEVCDQTLGVACEDCNTLLCVCWMDDHVPESLWNRAVSYAMSQPPARADEDRDDWHDAIRCEQDRDDVCAICEQMIMKDVKEGGTRMAGETGAAPFDMADFYTCDDGSEELSHAEVEAAIAEWLEGRFTSGCDVAGAIRKCGDVTVYAYRRESGPDDGWFRRTAEALVEHAMDDWEEDFGSPDRDTSFGLADTAQAAFEAALRTLVSGVDVWRCESVAKRVYSAEEVEKMMRVYEPSWFEKADEKSEEPTK